MTYKKIIYWTIVGLLAVTLIILAVLTKQYETNLISFKELFQHKKKLHEFEYGLPIEHFLVFRDKIRKNENLADIFIRDEMPSSTLNKLHSACKGKFELRKMKAGNKYTIFCDKDSSELVKYFVYEHTPVEYWFFKLSDSVYAEKRYKAIRRVTREYSDTIKQSLWLTITEHGITPMLAIELSDVYAWTIDFFMLNKKDYFKVIFDEDYVDETSIGVSKIHGIVFNHLGKDYYAIPYEQNGKISFFDENGASLKRQFLKAPLRFSRISSKFSYKRYHPVLYKTTAHTGVDYAAPAGTSVEAIGEGIVTEAYFHKGGGWMIKVRHNGTYTTAYLHLKNFAKGIRKGARVKQGQVIGYVGSTGLSTGPHLDFRVWKNGVPADPLKVQSPPVEPINKNNKIQFDSLTRELFVQFNKMDVLLTEIKITPDIK